MERLQDHRWPGNVRELENLIRRLCALYSPDTIGVDAIEAELSDAGRQGGPGEPDLLGGGLGGAVERHLGEYFAAHQGGLPPAGLYDRILAEIERPLIQLSLDATNGNQVRAAAMLGLNRNTLRKKIRELDITIVRGVGKLITGEVSSKQIAGPIGIAQIAGSALKLGWETFLHVMIFISINLGILNLLPIPILDGGQALVFSIEGIKRAPLSMRTRENFQKLGLTFLVLLMGLAFWNDISRHWAAVLDWLRNGTGL